MLGRLFPCAGHHASFVGSASLVLAQIVGDKFLREFGGYPARGWQSRGEKCVAEFWGKGR